jgi:hypothetical protein
MSQPPAGVRPTHLPLTRAVARSTAAGRNARRPRGGRRFPVRPRPLARTGAAGRGRPAAGKAARAADPQPQPGRRRPRRRAAAPAAVGGPRSDVTGSARQALPRRLTDAGDFGSPGGGTYGSRSFSDGNPSFQTKQRLRKFRTGREQFRHPIRRPCTSGSRPLDFFLDPLRQHVPAPAGIFALRAADFSSRVGLSGARENTSPEGGTTFRAGGGAVARSGGGERPLRPCGR